MGWKGTIRSLGAAARRAEREAQARENAAKRSLAKIDRSVDQVLRKAESLEANLKKDPIKTLGLFYDPTGGFTSEPYEFSTAIFSGSVSLTCSETEDDFSFYPPKYSGSGFTVSPMDLLITRWGTILALQIENWDQAYGIRTQWHKKSDPQSSSIYILDTENSLYYYPISSTLSGETLFGHPRICLVAFEPFRSVTNAFQIHVSDAKLTREKGKRYSFSYDCRSPSLAPMVAEAIAKPGLSNEIEAIITGKANAMRAATSGSGCMVFLAAVLSTTAAVGLILKHLS